MVRLVHRDTDSGSAILRYNALWLLCRCGDLTRFRTDDEHSGQYVQGHRMNKGRNEGNTRALTDYSLKLLLSELQIKSDVFCSIIEIMAPNTSCRYL